MVTSITDALAATSTPLTSTYAIHPLEAARTQTVAVVAAAVAILSALFAYLVTRLALVPTRRALSTQKEFIGNIAHELRTPLSVIKMNTEVALLNNNLSPESKEMHESNLEEVDRISGIIHNLLSLTAMIQPGRITFQNTDVGKIVHRVVERLTYLTKQKDLKVSVHVSEQHMAWANAAAVEQIISNLVRNAITNTKSGTVSVTITPTSRGLLAISVRDTGKGIKRAELLRIFEPFFRGDKARTREGGAGSGLGLSIVSELVKLHQGSINIRSALGRGTTVTVTLPSGRREEKAPVETFAQEPSENTSGESEVSMDFSHGQTKERRRTQA